MTGGKEAAVFKGQSTLLLFEVIFDGRLDFSRIVTDGETYLGESRRDMLGDGRGMWRFKTRMRITFRTVEYEDNY